MAPHQVFCNANPEVEIGGEMCSCIVIPKAELKKLEKRIAELEGVLKDIRDNWDCDNDAHRYGTPCRCCEAERVLGLKKW